MRCPRCCLDGAFATGSRVVRKGLSYNIIKCRNCGALFEEERVRQGIERNGPSWNACAIAQTKDGVVIEYFESIRQAVFATGYDNRKIKKCLDGAVDEIDGYGWKRI